MRSLNTTLMALPLFPLGSGLLACDQLGSALTWRLEEMPGLKGYPSHLESISQCRLVARLTGPLDSTGYVVRPHYNYRLPHMPLYVYTTTLH